MEKRIELEKRGRPAEEIVDLNLDNCRATQIDGLTDEFKNLESLSLINVGLTTLKGFPSLPNLRKLELSDNRISGSLNLLSGCPRLQYLNLSGNKIKDIEPLEPLKDFQELRNLDLFNCEVTGLDKYREKVFELLTTVQYLDGYDRENKEEIDDDEEDEDGDAEEIDDEEDGDDDDDDEDGDDIVDIDDDDDDDDDLDEDDDDEEEGEVGLSYLENDDLDGEEDGEDFEPENDDDDDDLPDDEDDEADGDDESRGVKRKHDDEEADN